MKCIGCDGTKCSMGGLWKMKEYNHEEKNKGGGVLKKDHQERRQQYLLPLPIQPERPGPIHRAR